MWRLMAHFIAVSEGGDEQPASSAPSRLWFLLRRRAASHTYLGTVVAWLFLCLSLTPSLLPRSALLQGVLSAITLSFGYGVGLALSKTWRYLELPEPTATTKRIIRRVSYGLLAVALIWFLSHLVDWQNNLRSIFGMEPVNDVWFAAVVLVLAVLLALLLLAVARLVARPVRRFVRWGEHLLPRRAGRVVGFTAGIVLVVFLINGVLVDGLVSAANSAFSVQNGQHDPDVEQPTSELRSGSDASLVSWDSLGQPGRKWVARGPTAEEINEFSGGGASEPIRVYVGLDSAGDLDERAQLAVDELIRTGAFDREVLVLATSTGSGGIDPSGTATLEYMHNGDTAVASFQYSFLPSWMSYFVDQASAKEAAQVFLEKVHDHWRSLSPDSRPAFYLFGVSLGSFGSEASSASIHTSGDPIDGAVWAGPTFMNEQWVFTTANRDVGTPAWLPEYDEGRVIRYTGRESALDEPTGEWLSNRFVYVQHPSDPVSFFSFDLLLHEPEWLKGERSPEMSPDMAWYPGVTFWQVALDLPSGGSVPAGYGHNFGAPSYIDAWVGVSNPAGWSDAASDRLKQHFAELDAAGAL